MQTFVPLRCRRHRHHHHVGGKLEIRNRALQPTKRRSMFLFCNENYKHLKYTGEKTVSPNRYRKKNCEQPKGQKYIKIQAWPAAKLAHNWAQSFRTEVCTIMRPLVAFLNTSSRAQQNRKAACETMPLIQILQHGVQEAQMTIDQSILAAPCTHSSLCLC